MSKSPGAGADAGTEAAPGQDHQLEPLQEQKVEQEQTQEQKPLQEQDQTQEQTQDQTHQLKPLQGKTTGKSTIEQLRELHNAAQRRPGASMAEKMASMFHYHHFPDRHNAAAQTEAAMNWNTWIRGCGNPGLAQRFTEELQPSLREIDKATSKAHRRTSPGKDYS